MSSDNNKPWRFVTSHTQVLLCLASDPEVRLRDVAERVKITERAASASSPTSSNPDTSANAHRSQKPLHDQPGRGDAYEAQSGHEISALLELLRLDPLAEQAD